ncbi:polysaccharide deacetylase family protein [Arcobacter sp. s6]|jgi:peptidoglycan/xylan/chitin deacetylase (PgdA/CDA1 family)|uniref:polysaccharide deacetylase family protein n=1 Tax=Arcobacter sp. s6 TaxID=3230363 RepID=UPI00349FE2D4
MKKSFIYALVCLLSLNAYAAAPKDDYDTLKKSIVKQFEKQTPKEWGENVKGVKTQLITKDKTIAITLDACGSPHGMAYDGKLISYLEKNQIPATLFINARWIDNNLETFKKLAANPLFEIGNHGMEHKPASVSGESAYGLKGTASIEEFVDEIEQSARKIQSITNKRPVYFRSGTAYYDEVAVKIANKLKHQVIGFSILGDAGATYTAKKVENAFLTAKNGDIVIAHFNHPESQTREGMIRAIEKLKKDGYKFAKLSDYKLK